MPRRSASHPLISALDDLGIEVSDRSIDRYAKSHDASHYALVPEAVAVPSDTAELASVLAAASAHRTPIVFRSGGTSLSGQAVTDSLLIDTRRHFQRIEVIDGGARVRVQPGATVRQVNARLARFGRKLGPDPASEMACTIGGVIADNSSGMSCGIAENSYQTVESMVLVLADGDVLDTSDADADARLRHQHPTIHAGLAGLRERLLASPDGTNRVRAQFSMKNTMGYGINALLDFDRPIDILSHLIVGSEGTLAFVAEATFRTVKVRASVSTGLLIFPDLAAATDAIPLLVKAGAATIELLDARSLVVAQQLAAVPRTLAELDIAGHTALLVELQGDTDAALAEREASLAATLDQLALAEQPRMTRDAAERSALWTVRKGIYPAIAGARPPGTTALLEDVVVPVAKLRTTCERLLDLFEEHGYDDAVIFGHAKDGNLHFMLTERFGDEAGVARYSAFTEDLVDLILGMGGSLKAEHGTGRVMAPFVRRQYGDELYQIMCDVKTLIDPRGILNPGVILTDADDLHLRDLKVSPPVEEEVDRCVECGYCEPTCPSRNLTLTPRQRITLRRDIAAARAAGDDRLAAELDADYDYEGVQTCAVDGMCSVACPVDIDTGDLARRLRAQRGGAVGSVWDLAATGWAPLTRAGGLALSVARVVPSLATAATDVARSLVGDDVVPRYQRGLPGGGARRPRGTGPLPDAHAVLFAACIGTMFGAEPIDDDIPLGSTQALRVLAERAGVRLVIPDGMEGLCCGTPWKSKGRPIGYRRMSDQVLPALLRATDGGRLPIVCDAASCTEGLQRMVAMAASDTGAVSALRFVDATDFVRDEVLGRLTVTTPVSSIAVHPTCSTAALHATDALVSIARHLSDDVVVPDDWGCCGFAGDRGLLHPELTASATAAEAAEVSQREFAAYVSANRTCEIALTRATGKPYRHILEVLEGATR